MRIITVSSIDGFADIARPKILARNISTILADVQKKGDAAVIKYEKKFGSDVKSLRVSKRELDRAYLQVSKDEIAAIKASKRRLEKSERMTKSKLGSFTTKTDGVKISKRFTPIESAGCYVPGGLARYPSSAVMSVTPAKVAGVGRIVVTTPPDRTGSASALTLVAADICGATEIYKTGGAQAIAALAFGTRTIRPVDKIVGPGGAFVTLAKSMLSGITAIDMLAGPTELCIVADSSAHADQVAADLISQAEHSRDTFCCMITRSKNMAEKVDAMLDKMTVNIPRGDIVRASLAKNGFIAVCKTKNDVIRLANRLAPEHLEIITRDDNSMAEKIKTPGLVLLGSNTPSSAGDYLLGSNHILPTNGSGKTRGSLSVLDFLKLETKVAATKSGLYKIAKDMKTLTDSEELPNHYTALERRLK